MSINHWVRRKLRQRLIQGIEPSWMIRHPRRSYYKAAVLSVPYWMTKEELTVVQNLRDAMTEQTGIEHVLDHIVPLNHPHVCGLTVPWNLQVITREHNGHKGNHSWPDSWLDQMDIFND